MIDGKEGDSGSGCLIGPKIVLTCAHNLYSHKYFKRATKIIFKLHPGERQEKSFVAEDFFYLPEYP